MAGSLLPNARPLIAVACLWLTASAPLAWATEPFAYEWRQGPVTLRWREGNATPNDAAVRLLVGHWKRLVTSFWGPSTAPLSIDVTLYGPQVGSGPPGIRLISGGRTLWLAATPPGEGDGPLTDVRLLAALSRLAPSDASGAPPHPSDDIGARVSPDGRWVAFRTWRSGTPEVWIASLDGRQVLRCVLPAGIAPQVPALAAPLIDLGPEWSADGRRLLWAHGGRLCALDLKTREGVVVTGLAGEVGDFAWSPQPGLAAVRTAEGRLYLLDLIGRRAVGFHQLLPNFLALGQFEWSPDGWRLLFLGQGGVTGANFALASPFARWLERVAGPLMGRRAREPEVQTGDYRDRLALLDLKAGRLETVALDPGPGALVAVDGVLWSPDALARTYLAGRRADQTYGLWRLTAPPLRLEPVPATGAPVSSPASPLSSPPVVSEGTLHTWPEPLLPIEWRRVSDAGEEASAWEERPVFIFGDRLVTLTAGDARFQVLGSVARLELAAGPDGGYRGVEEAELTEDEKALRLAVERAEGISRPLPGARRFAEAIYLRLDTHGPFWQALRPKIEKGDAVDLDCDPRARTAVVCVSAGGGLAELAAISADGKTALLSRALATATATAVPLRLEPFRVMGPRSGLVAITAEWEERRGVPLPLAIILILLVTLIVFRFLRRRRSAAKAG